MVMSKGFTASSCICLSLYLSHFEGDIQGPILKGSPGPWRAASLSFSSTDWHPDSLAKKSYGFLCSSVSPVWTCRPPGPRQWAMARPCPQLWRTHHVRVFWVLFL